MERDAREISPQRGLAGKTQDTSCYTGHLHLIVLLLETCLSARKNKACAFGKTCFPHSLPPEHLSFLSLTPPASHVKRKSKREARSSL